MREILFRGKDPETGTWYEGFYMALSDTTYCFKGDYDAHPDNTKHYIVFDSMTDWGLPNKHLRADADSTTVGQYTGLKDKNGKRIFEGDIVQYHERQFDGKDAPVCGVVIYTEGGFAVGAYFLNNWLWDSVHGNVQLRDVEVIGNIHDNPELLKGGEG